MSNEEWVDESWDDDRYLNDQLLTSKLLDYLTRVEGFLSKFGKNG